jgi:hypothetical protein
MNDAQRLRSGTLEIGKMMLHKYKKKGPLPPELPHQLYQNERFEITTKKAENFIDLSVNL